MLFRSKTRAAKKPDRYRDKQRFPNNVAGATGEVAPDPVLYDQVSYGRSMEDAEQGTD